MNAVQGAAKLESKLYRGTWQDGTLDIVAGGCLALMGLPWIFGYPALGPIVPALGVPIWLVLRQSITAPRMGQVTFTRQRQTRQVRWLLSTFGLGVAALVLFVVLYKFVMVRHEGDSDLLAMKVQWIAGLPPALLSVLSLCAALMLGQGRFVAYAGLLILAGLVVAVADLDPGWGLLGAGTVVSVIGMVMLARFMKRYPVTATNS